MVGKLGLDVSPRQCVGSRFASHPQLSGNISDSDVPHPSYSPVLALADFCLFLKFKPTLIGRRFQTTEETQENAIMKLHAIRERSLQEAFQQWKKCWELCIASRGDYFEWDRA